MAPRDFSTQKWLLSTVSRLPFTMSLPGWWYMRIPGPMTSVPSVFRVLMTFLTAIAAYLPLPRRRLVAHGCRYRTGSPNRACAGQGATDPFFARGHGAGAGANDPQATGA